MDKDIKLLSELVAIDTVAYGAHNYQEMASLLKEKIKGIGGGVDIIYAKAPDGKKRPNVIGRIDNGKEETVALNAHYDVVAVDRKDWKGDPFKLRLSGDRAYARGVSDDKSGVAIGLIAAAQSRANANLELVFTCDEELGSEYGLKWVMEKQRKKIRSDYAMVLDTADNIQIGCSGVCSGSIRILGKEHHAGMPFLGKNAIENSLAFLQKLKKFNGEIERFRSRYLGGDGSIVKGRFSITMINGGVSPNLIPGSVDVRFDMRSPPGTSVAKFKDLLRKHFEKIKKEEKVSATLEFGSVHESYVTDPHSKIVKALMKAVHANKLSVSFGGMDGTFFNQAGIPCVAYGALGMGDHTSKEYLRIKTFRKVQKEVIEALEKF